MKVHSVDSCPCCGAVGNSLVASGYDFEYKTSSVVFYYARCSVCGHIYLINVPLKAELSRIYPNSYHNYKDKGGLLAYGVKRKLDSIKLRRLKAYHSNVRSVLDIGCGCGETLSICSRLFKGCTLKGLEINADVKRYCIKGLDVQVGDIESTEIESASIDLIVMQQVIEHVQDVRAVMQKCSGALKAKGLLYVETPSYGGLDWSLFKRMYWGGYHIPRHFHIFSNRSMETLANLSGLRIEYSGFSAQPVHWIWSLHHYCESKRLLGFISRHLTMTNPVLLAIFTVVEVLQFPFTRAMSNSVFILSKK